jgi:hypothetical protein
MTAVSGLLLYHPQMRASLIELERLRDGKLVGLGSREYPALEIKPLETIDLLDRGLIDLGAVTDSLCYMLLNTAYEAVKQNLDKSNPTHEFFRHIRHGASHGGIWTFRGGEPKQDAVWRGRKIDSQLQGKKLWDLNLGPGDLVVLLWDIEKSLTKGAPQ